MKSKSPNLILLMMMALFFVASLAGCAKETIENAADALTLENIVEKLYDNVDVPPYETIKLDQTNFEYYTFIPYNDTLTAVAADALVNITPHSVVVIHSEDDNGANIAKKVIENADPNKWLCVGAETVNVVYTDHYVVLIMSRQVTADAIAENFKVIAKELDGMEMVLLTAGNSRYDQ